MTAEAQVLSPGSIVIERYVYDRDGKVGVQWITHRVRADGDLDNLIVTKTRREAARFIGETLRS